MTVKKERLSWPDICKGILITLLMFSHLVWVSKSKYDIHNVMIDNVAIVSSIWNCFFMACFFVLSGMFSNFKKPFKSFFVNSFKTLIFPALIASLLTCILGRNFDVFFNKAVLYGGGFWFLTALFFSKLFLWGCIQWMKEKWVAISILVVLSFWGKVLDNIDVFPNYWYHRNFLNFSLFLGVGYYFKDVILTKSACWVATVLFVITVAIHFILKIQIPSVVAIFNETMAQHALTIGLSVTGSITCIHFCKYINHHSILEFLGRNSLIVYIYHMVYLTLCISALRISFENITLSGSIILGFAIITSTLVFCSGVAIVMNTKYLKWMKGSF